MSIDYLYHYGILGQKWGIRRYQNPDGTLTEAGRKKYSTPMSLDKAHSQISNERTSFRRKEAVRTSVGLVTALAGSAGLVAGGASSNFGIVAAGGVLSVVGSVTLGDPQIRKMRHNAKMDDLIKNHSDVKLGEIKIDAGTKFNRTTLNPDDEKIKQRIYVGYEKDEFGKKYYGEQWPNYLRKFAGDPDADVYRNTYQVKTDIYAPSLEKRQKIAETIVKSDKKILTELGKEYAVSQMRLMTGNIAAKSLKEMKDDYSKQATDMLTSQGKSKKEISDTIKRGREMYDNVYKSITERVTSAESTKYLNNNDNFKIFTSTIPTSSKLMNAYISELKKQGYSAVFDDNANTEASFIVFDPSDLKKTKTQKLNV